MLHIGFLNKHDLSDHKREDDDFQSYVNTNVVMILLHLLKL